MILLKHFQKVSSDNKTTQLKHKDGHTINIAHHALSPKMRKQLDELPQYNSGGTAGLHEDYSKHDESDDSSDVKRARVQKSMGSPQSGHEDSDAEYAQRRKVNPNAPRLSLPSGMNYADGGTADSEFQLDLQNKNMPMSTPLYQQPQVQQQAQVQDQFGYEEPNAQLSEPPPSNMTLPTSSPTMQQNPIAQSMGNQASVQESALGQMEQGQRAEASAIGAQGKQEASAARQQQQQDVDLESQFQAKSKEIDAERMAVYNDLKAGHIEPNHYLQNMSGFGQAMTAIGLALGGYGAGINGGPNTAMEFLNKQIDRDVEAQKAEMGKKENLLSHLQQQFGNLRDATTMAKAIQRDLYSAKMEEAANASKDPQAQARAQQTIGQWHMQYEPQIQQMKLSQALLAGAKNGSVSPETLVQRSPLVPEHQRPEMVKQLGKLRAVEELRSNAVQSFNDMHSQFMNGALSPRDRESAKMAFVGKLVQLGEGRYNQEAAMNVADSLFPTRIETEQTSQNKLRRLNSFIDNLAAEPKSALQSVGIELPNKVPFTKRAK